MLTRLPAASRLVLLILAWLLPFAHAMQLGGNLTIGEAADQHVFIDLFRQARPWQTRHADGSGPYNTEKAGRMPVDANGWPLSVPFNPGDGSPPQRAHTVLGARGAGDYRLLVEGRGRLSFAADDHLLDPSSPFLRSVVFTLAGGSNAFTLTLHRESRQLIFVDILESDAGDPIRNIRLLPPGTSTESGPSGPFLATYLESIRHFQVLRFMDMGHVNSSPLRAWSERPGTNFYSQITAGGMAYEFMFDLANRAERSAWICVPHLADDAFARELARLAKSRLAPTLKLFIEFSNETWNFSPGFEQAFELDELARALGLTSDEYYAKRSAEIWRIFEEEFGAQEAASRLIKVLASQAGRPSLSSVRLEALERAALNPSQVKADALAIAPYFGSGVADSLASRAVAESVSVGEILDQAASSLRGEVAEWTRAQAAIAQQHNVWLVDYEAGQHLAATGPNLLNDPLTDKLIAANRSPRMKDLYQEYLAQQQRDGVLLCLLYYHTGEPSRFGSWGLLERLAQPAAEAPKWSGFLEWKAQNPPPNVAPRAEAGPNLNFFSRKGASAVPVTLEGGLSRDLDGSISSFAWRLNGALAAQSAAFVTNLGLGRHLAELTVMDSSGALSTDTLLITIAPDAAAQTLFSTTFAGDDPALKLPWTTTTTLRGNVTWSGFQASPAVNVQGGDDALHFWVSGDGAGEVQTLQNSIASGEFFSFTVTPTPPAALDLRGAILRMNWRRLTSHAPRQWALFSSIDGFGLGKEIDISAATESFEEPLSFQFNLPFAGWSGLINSVEFRLVPFGERFHGHQAGIESISLSGAAIIEAPVLTVTPLATGEVEISWAEGPYRLMRAPELRAGVVWEPVPAAGIVQDGSRFVRVAPSSARLFFRLESQ